MYLGSFRELPNAVRAAEVALFDAAGNQLSGFDASRPATATLTNVTVSAVSAVLAAANANRRQLFVVNDSGATVFVAFAATATATAFTLRIPKGSEWQSPPDGYTGDVSAILASGSGTVRVTEVTT